MFSNINDAWTKDPVKEITNKLSKNVFKPNVQDEITDNKNYGNASDTNSFHFFSENTLGMDGLSSDMNYAPVNFDKYMKNKYVDTKKVSDHDKCDKCYDKLKKLINDKINKKFDEFLLENKLKQIQNFSNPQITPQFISWRETLIIIIGVLIIVFILFLIFKSVNK